jgi:hypothetical protein
MDPVAEKAKQWIEAGKDARSAYWQAGLESVMNVFEPYLKPGKLTPIQPLEEADVPIFREALEVVDVSPNLRAAFLPPAVADKITAPGSAEELQRIDPEKPSYKIIIVRRGEEDRILCAEISAAAKKPGVDLFQAGALLGSYEFTDRGEFFSTLNKILRAHIWEKDRWTQVDYTRYTVNWFERVMDLNQADVAVDPEFSFFHSPTLIKSNRIDALFMMIHESFTQLLDHADEAFERRLAAIRELPDAGEQQRQFHELAQQSLLHYLTLIKDLGLMDFASFTDKESRQFEQEFERTVRKMLKKLA